MELQKKLWSVFCPILWGCRSFFYNIPWEWGWTDLGNWNMDERRAIEINKNRLEIKKIFLCFAEACVWLFVYTTISQIINIKIAATLESITRHSNLRGSFVWFNAVVFACILKKMNKLYCKLLCKVIISTIPH